MMNNKVVFAREAGKLAAYAFVTVGLFGSVIAQSNNTTAAFKAAFGKSVAK
jgi:hypothetical protein